MFAVYSNCLYHISSNKSFATISKREYDYESTNYPSINLMCLDINIKFDLICAFDKDHSTYS